MIRMNNRWVNVPVRLSRFEYLLQDIDHPVCEYMYTKKSKDNKSKTCWYATSLISPYKRIKSFIKVHMKLWAVRKVRLKIPQQSLIVIRQTQMLVQAIRFLENKRDAWFSLFLGQTSGPSPIVAQPSEVEISPATAFQRQQQQVLCKSCQQMVTTQTEHRISGGTWSMCCVIFFVGGFLCSFAPFLMKSCKDVVHRCPTCGAVIGRNVLI